VNFSTSHATLQVPVGTAHGRAGARDGSPTSGPW
jgi:hypothetical protein